MTTNDERRSATEVIRGGGGGRTVAACLGASLLLLPACGGGGDEAETPAAAESAAPATAPAPAQRPAQRPAERDRAPDPGSVFPSAPSGAAEAAPEPAAGPADPAAPPATIPQATLDRDDRGVPRLSLDEAAFAAFCRANDLPAPPPLEAIDAVGYAMIHQAVDAAAKDRSVQNLARLAFLYDGNDATNRAIPIYEELAGMAPDEFALHHLRGRALASAGRLDEALAAMTRATELRGDIAATWYRRGELELATEDVAAATASFERYQALQPNDGLADFALGRIDAIAGRYDSARPRLEAAVAARPDLAPAWLLLAQVRGRTGDTEGAREASERARALAGSSMVAVADPVESQMYRESQSVAYLQGAMAAANRAGLFEEAYGYARDLAQRQPTNALVARNLAVLAKRLNRVDEAVAHAERAAMLEPDRPRNRTTLSELYREVGRVEDSIREAELAVSLDPDSEVPRVALAAALLAANRLDEALAAADAAIERAPDRVEAFVVRAVALASLGRFAEGRTAIERALELAPGNAGASGVLRQINAREAAAAAAAEGGDPAGGSPPEGGGG